MPRRRVYGGIWGSTSDSHVACPPNKSFERTGHARCGSLRSVSVIVARRSTQVR